MPASQPGVADQRREVLLLLERLHRHKDAAYGDAWRKRGEVIAIFANMARKYDRLLIAFKEERPAATEALGDTAADLCVYTGKYLTWIAEQHPDAFTAAQLGIDPAAIGPAVGAEPLATVFTALAGDSSVGCPSDAVEGWHEVQTTFDTLDRALMAQSTLGAPTAGFLDFETKARLAWQLCAQLGWLLTLLEHDSPTTLEAIRADVAGMDRTAMP